MWSDGIVFFKPLLSDLPDLSQVIKNVQVKYFFPIGAVESLDVGILSWLLWLDKSLPNRMSISPLGQLL